MLPVPHFLLTGPVVVARARCGSATHFVCFLVLSLFCILLYTCANVICIKLSLTYLLSLRVHVQYYVADILGDINAATVVRCDAECCFCCCYCTNVTVVVLCRLECLLCASLARSIETDASNLKLPAKTSTCSNYDWWSHRLVIATSRSGCN